MIKRAPSYFIFLLLLFSASPVFAQSVAQSSLHSTGTVTVEVVDQDGKEMDGAWILHEDSLKGTVVYNGVGTETVKLYSGIYYLETEDTKGYDFVDIEGDNPQEVAPRGFITFRVIYYVAVPTKEEAAPKAPAEPKIMEPEVTPEIKKKPRIFVPPAQTTPKAKPSVTPPLPEAIMEAEDQSRSPLRGNPPETPYSLMGQGTKATIPSGGSKTISLAVTGPSSALLPVLLSLSAGTSFLFLRRRLKRS